MANKVVLELDKFEELNDFVSNQSVLVSNWKKAARIDLILKQAQIMDITPLPAPEPVPADNK